MEARNVQCIPFVSEYTDCTEENRCSGCNKCMCVGENKWSCETTTDCPARDDYSVDANSLDQALYNIRNELRQERKRPSSQKTYVPVPEEPKDLLLDSVDEPKLDIEDRIAELMRNKRSVGDQTNHTTEDDDHNVKFYHTVDEHNEDTLKNANLSGTLQAHKMEALPHTGIASRRNGLFTTDNLTKSSLHIEYNQPKIYDNHLTDNKIDVAPHNDDKYDALSHEKINKIMGNHTQKQKDKELSKLIVNELKSGSEVIGDRNAPVMSNITFTPENDTLTAMAFIAGNLLNKLWNMEKESGEDSDETEVLKHEKIQELLDLFKEPLNIRQGNFLKSALEHLSEAVDKDRNLKNLSICKSINEETKKIQNRKDMNEDIEHEKQVKEDCEKSKTTKTRTTDDENVVKSKTITKVNNILSLISQFQNMRKTLDELKKSGTVKSEYFTNQPLEEDENSESTKLSKDDTVSLNIFGNILQKITKLLLPPKKSKKISKAIKNQSIFANSQDIAKTLKEMYNIDVANSSITAKDKIIFDYLNNVKKNPKCLFDNFKDVDTKSMSRIEGDILLNLSEFFKVKSFVDLLNLIEPQSKSNIRSIDSTTPKLLDITTRITTTMEPNTTKVTSDASVNKLTDTKEKLKEHLKNIIDDLIEIQKSKGQTPNNVSIVDALPCIFKMLNEHGHQNKILNSKEKADKISTIFESLKNDLKTTQNRRSSVTSFPRPKSAVVWERIVKNFDGKYKLKNRRTMGGREPKTFDELKKQIEQIESSSKTYKNLVLVRGVPPAERLSLLKTLMEEARKNIKLLEDINTFLTNSKDVSVDKKADLEDYIENWDLNVNLNKRLIKNIKNAKPNKSVPIGKKIKPAKENNYAPKSMKMVDATASNIRNNMKLSRDSIINQLIRNRMQLYIKIKESKGADLSSDVNFDIAKRVLVYLDMGNYSLARELYKVLISQKQKPEDTSYSRFGVSPIKQKPAILMKEPLIQFEEPKNRNQWLSQDAWLKQLVNLKNMKV